MQQTIRKQFEEMGARAKLLELGPRDRRGWDGRPLPGARGVRIDIARDGRGEYFEIRRGSGVRIDVVDLRPADRHLLLMAREAGQATPSKFLCGHDERAWFVAAIPESARATNVQAAKDALKPEAVWESIRRLGVSMKERDRRRTRAFVRQGEWFFIPRPEARVKMSDVLRNEPIRRGAGKPHMCQFLFRDGGETVYVCRRYPNGLTEAEYREMPDRDRFDPWQIMRRNARVLVRGNIRHPDHATVSLRSWHEVVMNTETRAQAMQQVAFLD